MVWFAFCLALLAPEVDERSRAQTAAFEALQREGVTGSGYGVSFKGPKCPSDEAMAGLSHMTGTTFILINTDDAEAVALKIPEMKRLERMHIYKDVGVKGCERIGRIKTLEHLRLWGPWAKDEHLEHLGKMTNLKTLELRETKVSLQGVRRLKSKLPQVKVDFTK